jgi:hypothetical protein
VDDSGSLLWEYVRTKDGRTHDSVRLHNHQVFALISLPISVLTYFLT